jgi:hypothetical protein
MLLEQDKKVARAQPRARVGILLNKVASPVSSLVISGE